MIMIDTKKYSDTVSLFNIFRYAIKVNQYAFTSLTVDTVVNQLLDLANLDVSCIYYYDLVIRICKFCESTDTGIYYSYVNEQEITYKQFH